MTKVDFYILPDTTLEARLDFACRLTETIARKGYRLYLFAEDERMARELDDRLWDFRPDAYVPHALEGSDEAQGVAITIGWQGPPASLDPPPQAMLNLSPEIPEWFSRFERVAEIINQHQEVLSTKRECWKTYKQRGYPVTPHHLNGQR
ncbi:DNA polymerase III subunit chi [Halomonas binhaiensis]|uniref:DNA polymerase III subunit chi n=1 Tax=Halomonas binhaiensis TaxID=2562282 RepID=A0A5C1NLH9_9GAMM|nr:DNA polymerase III subunit chi [Halomonas binhaiensis]QEM83238.1 DNA polymerase III subunit chi [Halomonas binhaiensis]